MGAEELVFIDWKSDVGFKWLFARDAVAEHLLAFLKDLAEELKRLTIEDEVSALIGEISVKDFSRPTNQLEYLNVEVVTREKEDSIRKVLFDVYVKLPGGNRVILEMQKAPHKGLNRRMGKYLIRGIENSGGIAHVLIAVMNFKFSRIWGTSEEGSVVKVNKYFEDGAFVTVELGRFDKSLEELETGLDCWLFLFKNITKLKTVPEVFRGTIFEKIMDMSRIKALPKEEKEDWKKELDNNRYVQEGIQILAEQAAVEMAEKMAQKMAEQMAQQMAQQMAEQMAQQIADRKAEQMAIKAYQQGELEQLKSTIAKMLSKGMPEEKIKALLDLEELPPLA